MSDLLNQLTWECFSGIARLRELEGNSASPQTIHAQMSELVGALRTRGARHGLPEKDINDIMYAIAAFVDEVALRAPDNVRNYWIDRPLQLQLFGENSAGEGFFSRVQSLVRDGRRIDVLQVYHLCLLLGFQGKYACPGGDVELLRIMDVVRAQIEREQEVPEEISPSGDPPDEPLVRKANSNMLLWVSLGILALALAGFVGLRLSFNRLVSDLASRVEQIEH